MKVPMITLILMGVLFFGCDLLVDELPQEERPEEFIEEPIESEIQFYTLDKGSNSDKSAGFYTIRSEWEYSNLFGHASNGFDFNKEMVVAVYKGQRAFTGHVYEVTEIVEQGDQFLVTVSFKECDTCNTASSAPYHVIGLEKSNNRFIFEEQIED